MIIIDAGHGGSDPGTESHGVKEKDWTLEVALYQYKRLKDLGVPVKLTRSRDVTLESAERSRLVRESGAEICISSHFNAGGGSGCETIRSHFSHDPLAEDLARALVKKGMPLRRVYSRLGTDGRDYYYMHRLTGKVQTIIVEYGFLDSDQDFKKLDGHLETYAEAVVKVLCGRAGVKYRATDEGPAAKSGQLFRVQAGAFRSKSNAEKLKDELRKNGYPAVIIE